MKEATKKKAMEKLDNYESKIRLSLEGNADDISALKSEWQERDSPAERTLRDIEWNQFSDLNEALHEIEDARKRLSAGTYGTCEHCGAIIPEKRLAALPTARNCFLCQTTAESQPDVFSAERSF